MTRKLLPVLLLMTACQTHTETQLQSPRVVQRTVFKVPRSCVDALNASHEVVAWADNIDVAATHLIDPSASNRNFYYRVYYGEAKPRYDFYVGRLDSSDGRCRTALDLSDLPSPILYRP